MSRTIHKNWAFSLDEKKCSFENAESYSQLISQYKIKRVRGINEKVNDEAGYDIVIAGGACYYGRTVYYIMKAPAEISVDELALICDTGNLCFGYEGDRKEIVVYTD